MATDRKAYKSLLIDKDAWKRLKLISVERELPMTQIIRELLDLYEQQSKPKKASTTRTKAQKPAASKAKSTTARKPKTSAKKRSAKSTKSTVNK